MSGKTVGTRDVSSGWSAQGQDPGRRGCSRKKHQRATGKRSTSGAQLQQGGSSTPSCTSTSERPARVQVVRAADADRTPGRTRTARRCGSAGSARRSCERERIPFRLKVRYRLEAGARLQLELGLANPMQVPRLDKVVVNMGSVSLEGGRMLEAASRRPGGHSPVRSPS